MVNTLDEAKKKWNKTKNSSIIKNRLDSAGETMCGMKNNSQKLPRRKESKVIHSIYNF